MKKLLFLIFVVSIMGMSCSPLCKITKPSYKAEIELKMKSDSISKSKMYIGTSLDYFTLYY